MNTKLLGFLAVGHFGTTHRLTDPKKHPRGQLLEKCGGKHANKMFVDGKDGVARHIGYIVSGEWFTIYRVHSWEGGR